MYVMEGKKQLLLPPPFPEKKKKRTNRFCQVLPTMGVQQEAWSTGDSNSIDLSVRFWI
jgi:hypothetical protein